MNISIDWPNTIKDFLFFYLDTYQTTASYNNIHSKIWKGLIILEHDIVPDVANAAQKLTKYIRQKVSNIYSNIFVNYYSNINLYMF